MSFSAEPDQEQLDQNSRVSYLLADVEKAFIQQIKPVVASLENAIQAHNRRQNLARRSNTPESRIAQTEQEFNQHVEAKKIKIVQIIKTLAAQIVLNSEN